MAAVATVAVEAAQEDLSLDTAPCGRKEGRKGPWEQRPRWPAGWVTDWPRGGREEGTCKCRVRVYGKWEWHFGGTESASNRLYFGWRMSRRRRVHRNGTGSGGKSTTAPQQDIQLTFSSSFSTLNLQRAGGVCLHKRNISLLIHISLSTKRQQG